PLPLLREYSSTNMLAPSANQLSASMAGAAAGESGASLAGAAAAFSAATLAGPSRGETVAASSGALKCVSFMRHSIATHNEAASASADAMGSVYLSEAYADSSLSPRGHALVRRARQSMLGLSPTPSIVLCSPLTRAIQTAIAMFGGTGVRIVAVPDVREAHGRFPCDRHRDRSELEHMFGDCVDFSLCEAEDKVWSPVHREEMSHLDDRVARFVDSVLQGRMSATGEHVFVVSHGVFIETALRQLTYAHSGHSGKSRVHNCDVHSFVFSVPSPPSSSTSSGASSASAASSAAPSSASSRPAVGSGVGGGGGGGRMPPVRPRVEAYLTAQGLALSCAAGMPLTAVAHVNRVVRRFCYGGSSGGGGGAGPGFGSGGNFELTEKQFSALLARCGLGAQEIRWLYCALDREGGGRVASGDLLLALMAFYSG
ncbi:unnamed protein product, partial [Scytosiphon promiscuus]